MFRHPPGRGGERIFPVRLYRPHASAAVHALSENCFHVLPKMQGAYRARSRKRKEATRFGTQVGAAAIPAGHQRIRRLSSSQAGRTREGGTPGESEVPVPQMQIHRSTRELARRYARVGRAAQVSWACENQPPFGSSNAPTARGSRPSSVDRRRRSTAPSAERPSLRRRGGKRSFGAS